MAKTKIEKVKSVSYTIKGGGVSAIVTYGPSGAGHVTVRASNAKARAKAAKIEERFARKPGVTKSVGRSDDFTIYMHSGLSAATGREIETLIS